MNLYILVVIILVAVSATLGILYYKSYKRLRIVEYMGKVTLDEKILLLVKENQDEFVDMAWDGVSIVFNPTIQGASLADVDCIPENINDFFNDIADKLIDEELDNASGV